MLNGESTFCSEATSTVYKKIANNNPRYRSDTIIAATAVAHIYTLLTDDSRTRRDTDIQEDKTVTAIFHEYYMLRYWSYDNSEGGYILGDEFQYIKHGESGSTVTAIPKEGYEFECWDDDNTDPRRTDFNIVNHRTYTAYFTRKKYKVEYKTSNGSYGWISCIQGRGTYTYYGEQSSTVRAIPKKGYVFVEWSDGSTTPERTEHNVKSDMTFTAYFGYSAEYKVNNGVGGKIAGKTSQAVRVGCDFDEVEAVPDEGYVFGGWSDLRNESKRKDTNAERGIEHIAYFEPIERTFKYDYGIATGIPMESSVIIDRNNIRLNGYPTPSVNGYTFEGWYTDKDYTLKAINAEGVYMLGTTVFRWIRIRCMRGGSLLTTKVGRLGY